MNRALIIIPTYNEINNISELIDRILALEYPSLDILFVDDNSPDGTGDFLENISKERDNIHVMARSTKLGLGTAYISGFKWAIINKAPI